MRAALSLRLAYEYVRAGFGRMVLSIVAIALGVALVVSIRFMNTAVLASFVETADAVIGRAALSVSAGEGLTFPEDVRETVERVQGVKLAVPLVRTFAFPDDGSGELLTVHGVDLAHEAEVRVYHDAADPQDVVDDLLVFLSQPDSIIIGREFAEERHLGIGSRLPLVTPSGSKVFTVRGLLDAQGLAKALAGRFIVMDLFAAERAFTSPGRITQIDVLLDEGASVEDVKPRLAAAIPSGLEVEEPLLRKNALRRTIAGFQGMLTAFSLLAAVAGFVFCYSRLGAIFEARAWEIGILRSLGLRRLAVLWELLKESLLLGVAGVILGVPAGLVVARHVLPVVAKATALVSRLTPTVAVPVMDWSALVFGAVVGLASAVAAAIRPALRVSFRPPATALRLQERDVPLGAAESSGAFSLAFLVVAVALVGLQMATRWAGIGFGTTAVLALAACLAGAPLVRYGSPLLMRVWTQAFGVEGAFAAEHLREQPRRSSLVVATLGFGLGTVLVSGMLGKSFEASLVDRLSAFLRADIVLMSPFSSAGYFTAAVTDRVVDEIRRMPGIANVGAVQGTEISYGDGDAVLYAYDTNGILDPALLGFLVRDLDTLEAFAAGRGILVTDSFAHRFGVHVGDWIAIPAPAGERRYPLLAIVSTEPTVAVLMNRDEYRRFWKDDHVRWINVRVAGGVAVEEVRRGLKAEIARRYNLQVISGRAQMDFYVEKVRQVFSALYVVQAIVFILVFVGLGDALATGVIERTRTLAMMRAVGLPRRALFSVIVLEGLGVGALGLLLAGATALTLGVFWVAVQFPAVSGWIIDLHVPVALALVALAATVALCLGAAVPPALRVAYLPIGPALRGE
jgi:putative ABC transport system permease protein